MRIGLTGGIGSGKTTVCQLFADHGVPIIDADLIARQVVEPGNVALNSIRKLFGDEVILPSGELDRAALRAMAFADQSSRIALEGILHPRIRQAMETAASQITEAYCILAIPLLLETGLQSLVDRILVIDTSESQQIARVASRDKRDDEETRRIIAAQIPRQERIQAADDIIQNDGTIDLLRDQVASLHQRYLNLSVKK